MIIDDIAIFQCPSNLSLLLLLSPPPKTILPDDAMARCVWRSYQWRCSNRPAIADGVVPLIITGTLAERILVCFGLCHSITVEAVEAWCWCQFWCRKTNRKASNSELTVLLTSNSLRTPRTVRTINRAKATGNWFAATPRRWPRANFSLYFRQKEPSAWTIK